MKAERIRERCELIADFKRGGELVYEVWKWHGLYFPLKPSRGDADPMVLGGVLKALQVEGHEDWAEALESKVLGSTHPDEYNILMTARRGEGDYLMEDLEGLGEFDKSGFRDVLIGKVEDVDRFLEELNSRGFPSLSRVVPIDQSFKFDPSDFEEKLADVIAPYAEEIEAGETYEVDFTRRGYKGKINTQEVEREAGSVIWKELEGRDIEPEVDLEDPDKTVVVETIGDLCLVGLVTRRMKDKYYLLKF